MIMVANPKKYYTTHVTLVPASGEDHAKNLDYLKDQAYDHLQSSYWGLNSREIASIERGGYLLNFKFVRRHDMSDEVRDEFMVEYSLVAP